MYVPIDDDYIQDYQHYRMFATVRVLSMYKKAAE